MRFFKKTNSNSKSKNNYDEEDYKKFIEAVIGGNLYYLKKCAISLGDEELFNASVEFEKKYIKSLKRIPADDVVDIALFYLDDIQDSIRYLGLSNEGELLKDLQHLREIVEKRKTSLS